MDIENSKPDLACKNIYTALARSLMPEMHENLLDTLKSLEGDNNIVIVGPGPDALPYLDNWMLLDHARQNGKIVFVDYNKEILDKLEENIKKKYNELEKRIKKIPHSVDFVAEDVRTALKKHKGDAGFIDMTVSVHHATQYRYDLQSIIDDAYSALKSGGILHIGEGNVDMKYSEEKINKIIDDVYDTDGIDRVVLQDRRYNGETRTLSKGLEEAESTNIEVNADGIVQIDKKDGIEEYLRDKGYKQIVATKDKIVIPLIDHAMEDDIQGLIVPVRQYYAELIDATLPGLDEKYHKDFMKAILKEQSDAERGVVEFYSPPQMVKECMEKVGFKDIVVRYTNHGPFVNITGKK